MHTATQQFHAILFADIAGSTRLHENLGDKAAHDIIAPLLTQLAHIAQRHGGVLVRTMADEILCRFSLAERALNAAIAMQEALADDHSSPVPLQLRMGLHWGMVILETGDIFGDAVNRAARMSAIARAGQIITSHETVQMLSESLAEKAYRLDTAALANRTDDLALYQIRWQDENPAAVHHTGTRLKPGASPSLQLQLQYQDQSYLLAAGSSAGIGRAETCEIIVSSPLASRLHARIESRRGKFIFIDQSTNGSYVRHNDGRIAYLRREELLLGESGEISLGEELDNNRSHWLYFKLATHQS